MPSNVKLTRQQRNSLFNSISVVGLDPTDFSLEELSSEAIPETFLTSLVSLLPTSRTRHTFPVVFHTEEKMYFEIHRSTIRFFPDRNYAVRAEDIPIRYNKPDGSPSAPPLLKRTHGSVYFQNWEWVLKRYMEWLRFVHAYVIEPDLWELSKQANIGADTSPIDNSPFTEEQHSHIHVLVGQVMTFVKEDDAISEDRLKRIEEKLDYMDQSAQRLGRKDWLNIVISQLLSIATAAAMTPERTQALSRIVTEALKPVYGVGLKLLGN